LRDLVPDVTWNGGRLEAPPPGLLAVWLAGWTGAGPTLLHVAGNERRARALAASIRSLAPSSETLLFPPWDCLPYDRASPSRAVMGERLATLRRLQEPVPAGGRIVVTTVDATAQRLPPREALDEVIFPIVAGEALDLEALRRFLLRTGHVLDERVDEPGEAALRGAVADLYPATSANPFRLELEDGRVVSIRPYDALTQRSLGEVAELVLEPASEALLPPGSPEARRSSSGSRPSPSRSRTPSRRDARCAGASRRTAGPNPCPSPTGSISMRPNGRQAWRRTPACAWRPAKERMRGRCRPSGRPATHAEPLRRSWASRSRRVRAS
jgi:transcription-repair coupling factor (superfamily II helicase)